MSGRWKMLRLRIVLLLIGLAFRVDQKFASEYCWQYAQRMRGLRIAISDEVKRMVWGKRPN